MVSERFWDMADTLVGESALVIDRPRGSQHPRYADAVYPLDYGYLAGSRSEDDDGIDIWIGKQGGNRVTGVIVTIDLAKRDSEIKLLIGCSPDEAAQALAVHQSGSQGALLLLRNALLPEGNEQA